MSVTALYLALNLFLDEKQLAFFDSTILEQTL
jgi:hypothetical protein